MKKFLDAYWPKLAGIFVGVGLVYFIAHIKIVVALTAITVLALWAAYEAARESNLIK